MNWSDIQEEELKNQVAAHYFGTYDCTKIVGRIDFAVTPKLKPGQKQAADNKIEYLLWAEAKRGTVDLDRAITQLILTIGKEINRGHAANLLPPPWLGAFDCSSIIFLPYDAVQDFFSTNDFNWNVAPSNHGTREFDMVLRRVKTIMEGDDAIRFDYASRHDELKAWIRDNLRPDPGSDERIIINRNNFVPIFQLWDKEVRPTIDINWDVAKKEGYISADFFLADLLSDQNHTQMLDLFVLLKGNKYQYNKRRKASGSLQFEQADFNDGQRAHKEFWRHYRRPPRRELWHELVERRDLLVPQDVRERKGSFFTPQIWVRKSQEYLADVLGPDWQDEYTIWDCCAGTGNLLNGLKNKWNIWASTLDQADVQVMRERIENGANLLPEHVFQFDFLNDNFSKLPPPLRK